MDPATLLVVAVDAASQAGALLLDGSRSLHRGALRIETKSTATDMVSEMDRSAEHLIRRVIASHRPQDAVLGEEGGWIAGASPAAPGAGHGVQWIVDPLDGTTNFLYGYPAWCVSVAAEHDGAVVAGVVFDPVHDELWTATRGGGARCNGAPLPTLVDRSDLEGALTATGFGYQAERRAAQGRVAAEVVPRVRDLRRSGSAALDLCWLAAGRVDAYYEEGIQRWDWAAGALVASEAGAWVGGLDGGAAGDDGVLAARPALAAELRALLRPRAASRR